MQVHKSAMALAIGAAAALIGVGAQAASNSAGLLADPAPATSSPMATPIDGGVPWTAGDPSDGITTTYAPSEEAHPTVPPTLQPGEEPTPMEDLMRAQVEKTRAFANTLVGMNIDAAFAQAIDRGFEMRIVERDGENFAVTMDYRTNRVNVWVTDDIVTKASVG